jgi:hypothetical protein
MTDTTYLKSKAERKINAANLNANCVIPSNFISYGPICKFSRSQWPRGLKRGSAAARLLGIGVSDPTGGMDVCLLWVCVLSGRGLCVGLIPRPEESYRLWCVSQCDREAPIWGGPGRLWAVAPLGRKNRRFKLLIYTSKLHYTPLVTITIYYCSALI